MKYENFEIIKELGKGALGTIYLVKYKNSEELFALKIYKKRNDYDNLEKSAELAMDIDHPNLMICKTFFTDTINDNIHFFSLLEYIDGNNLRKITLNYRKENKLCSMPKLLDSYLPQIISALKYLHSNNIIHRDIKPENIIICENRVKIIDYDFLKENLSENITRPKGVLGTPYYIAPEIYTKYYDERVDLWALGILIYFCITATQPFNAKSKGELEELVTSEFEPSYKNIPFKYIQIISGLIRREPDERFTLNNVLTFLKTFSMF